MSTIPPLVVRCCITALCTVWLSTAARPLPAQSTPASYSACYVPSVGAIYMIKKEGLPSTCLASTHVEITWTDGAGAGQGTITGVTAGAGLTGGGATGAITLDVAFAGSGVAASAARSDHTHTFGTNNTAAGTLALAAITTGGDNTALGSGALGATTTATRNTAVGSQALAQNTGERNTAVGFAALMANSGPQNVAVGGSALRFNQTGENNVAVGVSALLTSTTGEANVAVGNFALTSATSGAQNVAVGYSSLGALTAGDQNIVLGAFAGSALTSGSRNIYIGSPGAATEDDRIRIGNTANAALQTYLAGVRGVTTNVADAVQVFIASDGQLGTVSSSIRYKEGVSDLGHASRALMRLRPVQFRYIQPAADGSKPVQYGLIAEEVAKVLPRLVAFDSTGTPATVYYHMLPVLLLNEMQRQDREIAELRQTVSQLAAAVAGLREARAASGSGSSNR